MEARLICASPPNACREGDKTLELYTTVVPPGFEGKGIAKLLALEAFQFCRESGSRMKLTCSYLDGYMKKNPDSPYSQLVVKDES